MPDIMNIRKHRHYQQQSNLDHNQDKEHHHGKHCHYCRGTGVMKEEGRLPRREKLFDKVITQSDIKQFRLAIPKHQAMKHFTLQIGSGFKDALLCMEDNKGKVWAFKYTFWRSCHGYVLTREWSQFVKEKRLNAGDVVSFFRSNGPDKRLYIDCKPKTQSSVEAIEEGQTIKLFGVDISQ